MRDDLKFKHPFTCILCGQSSGNSSFCIRYVQKFDALCTEHDYDGEVIWCCSEKTAVPSTTLLPKRNVHYNEGVPTDFENARGRSCLVILDDLLNDVLSKQVCDFFYERQASQKHERNSDNPKPLSPGSILWKHFPKRQISGHIEKRQR